MTENLILNAIYSLGCRHVMKLIVEFSQYLPYLVSVVLSAPDCCDRANTLPEISQVFGSVCCQDMLGVQ